MKSARLFYAILFCTALVATWAWITFSYPRFAVVDLSVGRPQAVETARAYLQNEEHIDLTPYLQSVIFTFDNPADRYLQKSLGFQREEEFIERHRFDLYIWLVRFMKEGDKEEYRVAVSSKTGEVISFVHQLPDAAQRPAIEEAQAQQKAEDFLRRRFGLDFANYAFHSKSIDKFDHRIEYTFDWEKKDVYVPWSPDPRSGGAKLISTVKISGQDVLGYSKQLLLVPDSFNRDIDRKRESGRNLGLVSTVLELLFLIGAIWLVVHRRNHLAMHVSKRFYIGLTVALFVLSIVSGLNNAQAYIFEYPTTQPFVSFLTRQIIQEVINRFFIMACFIIPCLAGELVHFEMFPKKPEGGFFHHISTTFLSREVAWTIALGYILAVVMVGTQAMIFEFGFRYLNVWMEQSRLSQMSSGYFPFLAALIVGATAAFQEETFYRLFAVSFGVKFFRNLGLAIVVASVVWGLGHTGYQVFPFWFRGLEVSLLGILMCFIYLRFGLICVIVVHFLFDAFWGASPYIFGHGDRLNFAMSIIILCLPLAWAVIAYVINRPVEQKPLQWRLNAAQKFNLEILKAYIGQRRADPGFEPDNVRNELIRNGWDVAVIDVAFGQLGLNLDGDSRVRGF